MSIIIPFLIHELSYYFKKKDIEMPKAPTTTGPQNSTDAHFTMLISTAVGGLPYLGNNWLLEHFSNIWTVEGNVKNLQ